MTDSVEQIGKSHPEFYTAIRTTFVGVVTILAFLACYNVYCNDCPRTPSLEIGSSKGRFGSTVLLFVRQEKRRNGLASPYSFFGSADYVSHQGSRPMNIIWKLRHPMPPLRTSRYSQKEAFCQELLTDPFWPHCNELAYDGALQPQRGARDPASILPTWGYAHLPGTSRKYAKSRCNLLEVEVIADWIKDNFSRIRAAYPHEKQDDLIGVITPFSRQAALLSAELAARGISGVTVGTVHRLQGAQRRVIIFSPVYDRAEAAAPFINRSRNMMNVAVSRAQDCFLVFGIWISSNRITAIRPPA